MMGKWRAVAFDPESDEEVWTVSKTDKPGWNTDCGYSGYGLTKADAEELAEAANLIVVLRDPSDELLRKADIAEDSSGEPYCYDQWIFRRLLRAVIDAAAT